LFGEAGEQLVDFGRSIEDRDDDGEGDHRHCFN
jgi:hypothetical protein